MLLAKGYPDIGWNPCGGERYLDFLRFAVFVNGEAGGGGNRAGGWGAVMGQTSLGCGPYSRPQAWPGQGCLLVGTGQGPEVKRGPGVHPRGARLRAAQGRTLGSGSRGLLTLCATR